jgi:choline dehydrogenase-like flavoprotein
MLGKLDGLALKAGAPPLVPLALLESVARHSFDFWLTTEDLPSVENRVTLEPDGQIRLAYTPNNLEAHARLVQRVKRVIAELLPYGLRLDRRIPLAGTAHQCGTLRFGDDAATSILNRDCRAHELENLYVADASVFPSSSAVNPGLTIMANALRVADAIGAELGVRVDARELGRPETVALAAE